MGRFINPFTDVGFKRIFGQEISKPLIIDFLNSLKAGKEHIEDLTFLDKEQPALYDDDRSLIYDVYCTTDDGRHIIVEMQNKSQPYFKDRSIYYVAEAVARQGERGASWKYSINAVYLVAFLNFCPLDFEKTFRTDVALADVSAHKVFSDKVRMTYLQLPLFTKEVEQCDDDFDKWIYVLKNMETLTRLPWAAKSAVFKRLEEITEVASLSKHERLKYDEGLRKYRDTLSVLDGAMQDGLAQGMAQGMAQGLAEGEAKGLAKGLAEGEVKGVQNEKKDTARRLLAMGLANDVIVAATGLTADEIANLQ